ncbi:hypothetical protein [Plantactinospora mayteni]|uniref:hypothetical protein n=1 Tax=Plantactinospora mayteni TaxID=566021 RepID=UPI001942A76C|nr:hypothetical protein [Plantactinospora mayteni]
MESRRLRALGYGVLLVLLLTGGCRGAGVNTSPEACNDARALLGQFHGLRGSAEEVRATQIEAMQPELAKVAESADGDVKGAIQGLVDAIESAGIDSSQPAATLRPKLAEFDTAFEKVRQEFDEVCD